MLKLFAPFLFAVLFTQWSLAQDQRPFPTTDSKKGLQVQMVDDALTLGIRHAGINVNLAALLADAGTAHRVSFRSDDREYFINEDYARSLDRQIKPLSDAGVLVYLILIQYPSRNPEKDAILIHPKARADGKYIIPAFNTANDTGLRHYRALIEFLAARYSGASSASGQVWGYIVGNEVNSQFTWYNLGQMPVAEAAVEYEKAVRSTHDAVRRHSLHARCYLSFDHHWNISVPGISPTEAYKTKEFLDNFARTAREHGDFEWHVAHHPYPDDLGNPRTWEDKNAWPTEDSPHITFKNLEVATRHMTRPDLLWQGKPRRIILSEQGLHCPDTPDGETLQAAGFAYVWEKVRRQPDIDALIWHRHVDHTQEGGLKLGLWTTKPGTISEPGRKRPFYDLFQKANTPAWDEAAKFALPVVGLKSWDELKGP
ncbi:DUF5722 domain-containing protein [Verrucomicrobium sp. BvORR106]|uniref:DUF5722 domain-containing protein n=1 Tax=Verrucomicrobium sp. BvORR106 TaxID=1403819 RepID=UPI00068D9371|nr:DUF5722 domain-containing protein [Verrucomicrobium sp. BvORR106]